MTPHPPPPRVSETLRHRFAPYVRDRGERYHRRGAVQITTADAAGIGARVQGSRRYSVSLAFADDGFKVSCDCPAFGSAPCKHVWATLLTAEERGLLDPQAFASGAGTGSTAETAYDPEVLPDLDEDDLDDAELAELEDDPDFLSDADPASAWRPSRARLQGAYSSGLPLGAPRHVRSDSWQQRLDELARLEALETAVDLPAGQIVYVLDAEATRAAGALNVEVARRRRSKNGDWGAPMALRLRSEMIPRLPDAADRELLALLRGAQPEWYGSYGEYGGAGTLYRLPSALAQMLVPRLCASGRCLMRANRTSPATDLRWDDGEAWEFWLELRRTGDRYAVEGLLRRSGEKRPLSDPLLIVDGLVFFEGTAARFESAQAFHAVVNLRRHGPLSVPASQARDALERLLLRRERPRLALDPELQLAEAQGVPAPRLTLRRSDQVWTDRLQCTLSFDYEGTCVPATDPNWCVLRLDERRLLVRDRAAEAAAAERLRSLGFRWIGAGARGPGELQLSPRHMGPAVRALLAESWRVEAEGKLYRPAKTVSMEVVSGVDWFDLKGSVEFEGASVGLPALLAALRKAETTVVLGDGSVGMLPEEWLKRYALLAAFGSHERDALRFRRSQAGVLDALLAAQPAVSLDEGFEQARRALREFDGVRPADQPQSFSGKLREYQRQGLGWLRFLEQFGFGGCLADEMGLGKTIQVLAHLEARRSAARGRGRGPSLVVVPRSLLFNWRDEAARFVPRLRILDHAGPQRAREAGAFRDFDVVLTTYGTLRRDSLLLKDVLFDYVVLDEAQAVKNASTESAKAARLLQARYRLALSGTPVENHIGELWSLFEFLNPGMLGRAEVFRRSAATGLGDAERGVLARALRPLVLRRTKGEVARDLPPKVEQTVHCELDAPQRKVYDELRRHYRQALLARVERDGIARSKMHVLEALLRLRQAACHPGLIDARQAGEPCAKIDVLLPRLEEVSEGGHKALVFSQFTSFLAILRRRLDAGGTRYEYLDGRTRDRAERVRRFQEQPGGGLFLISLKAGGLGLNLAAAEYVFLLDPWWNPAVEAQAIDRAHRIGQNRHVFAYRLIAKDTVEEKVLELQEKKRGLAEALLGSDKSLLGDLRREDLELLLS